MKTVTYKVGDEVEAEVYDGEWKAGTVISVKTRANGQTFYRISIRKWSPLPWLTAKRLRLTHRRKEVAS